MTEKYLSDIGKLFWKESSDGMAVEWHFMVVYLEEEIFTALLGHTVEYTKRSIVEFLFTRKTCWKSQKIISEGVLAY